MRSPESQSQCCRGPARRSVPNVHAAILQSPPVARRSPLQSIALTAALLQPSMAHMSLMPLFRSMRRSQMRTWFSLSEVATFSRTRSHVSRRYDE